MQVNRKKNLRFSPFKANQYFNVRFCVVLSAAAALCFFAMTKLTKLTNSGQNHLLSSPSCAGRAQDVISTNCYSRPAPWLQTIVILGANTPIHGKNSCWKQR